MAGDSVTKTCLCLERKHPKRRRPRPRQYQHQYGRRTSHTISPLSAALILLSTIPAAAAVTMLPLRVTNNCKEPIWPAILTQSGTGPASSGFLLGSGATKSQTVGLDWKGRVWARTNCSFPTTTGSTSALPPLPPSSGQGGSPCQTGDCGMFLECQGAGQAPATLAEFTMSSDTNQCFYDISLVDGYNIPMGIISLLSETDNANLTDIPPNLTNPVCIGTSSLLAPVGDAPDVDFGTNSTYPLPLDQSVTSSFVQDWCPWPLQLTPPTKPGDGVYPYPDDSIQRPIFNPCLSACAKWNKAKYCCTGDHGTPATCSPSLYSQQAKKLCPDAYSYAYDDQTSTFIIPQGGGFEVVFCPAGRSTRILATFGDQLRQLAQTGHATRDIVSLAQNVSYIKAKSAAVQVTVPKLNSVLAVLVGWLLALAVAGGFGIPL
ncbi:hypothetical protein AYO21_05078 [Fonsecaea monophora]|uniref:Osmotin, thaumatin-like protein n=1 Tax=Fonsecaea monophora TaxID=254056 RepID=A0A177FAW4_9EURO|nr:hypothetical protein AYO21_05078 [Fonsecaea monophora]KAH0837588.1 thaumatin family protein [Fonsecaea pedrosoi]OAG40780.1 hypothetical protein AYO21_05078 [Fonsecaea monophora]